jgi:hypothetical protein
MHDISNTLTEKAFSLSSSSVQKSTSGNRGMQNVQNFLAIFFFAIFAAVLCDLRDEKLLTAKDAKDSQRSQSRYEFADESRFSPNRA